MENRDKNKEILSNYANSSLVVDLRALMAEREKKSQPLVEVQKKVKKLNKEKADFKLFKELKEIKLPKISFEKFVYHRSPTINDVFKKDRSFNWSKIKKQFSWDKRIKSKKEKEKLLKAISYRQKAISLRAQSFFVSAEHLISGKKYKTKKKNSYLRNIFSRLPAFFLVLLFLVIPLKVLSSLDMLDFKDMKARVLNNSYSGVNNLLAAASSISSFDLKEANLDLSAAGASFLAADEDLSKINDAIFLLASLVPNPEIKLASQGRKFLSAGARASSLGRHLIAATDSLFAGDQDFSNSLDSFISHGLLAVAEARELNKILQSIDENGLPQEYRAKFNTLKDQSVLLSDNLAEFLRLSDKLKDLLGLSMDKRYLLVFQNNTELRASGGFLGSYALVDIRDGKIRNLEVPAGGSYDLEAGLQGKKFASPYALTLVNPLWNFWDANWWPDWPKTAKHLMWFYEQSGGPSVDGVISLTPTVVEGMLEITGPIDMTEDYGIIITADNFWENVQKVVEYKNLELTHPEALEGIATSSNKIVSEIPLEQDLENNSDNKPKKIIGDLMAKMLEILPQKISRENLPAILSVIEKSAFEKQILFYLNDETAQQEISNYGLSGEIKDSDHDYLMIVDTNIAGQKTDRVMEKNVVLSSDIKADGSIINTLIIKRGHSGEKRRALVGVRNVNWLRVYVPKGAKLISASGFETPDAEYFDPADPEAIVVPELENEINALIDEDSSTMVYEDSNKTVFANWTMTDPGQTTEIKIVYLLPFNFHELNQQIDDNWWTKLSSMLNPEASKILPYSFLLQKQAGAYPFNFELQSKMPQAYEKFWESKISDADHLFKIKTSLDKDSFYSALIRKKEK